MLISNIIIFFSIINLFLKKKHKINLPTEYYLQNQTKFQPNTIHEIVYFFSIVFKLIIYLIKIS